MAGPVVNRTRSHDPVLGVEVGPIELQSLHRLAALVSIEPALRQHGAHRLDAVLNAQARRDVNRSEMTGAQPEVLEDFDAARAGAQLTGLRVVRQDVAAVDVVALDQLADIVTEIHA
jgi:hypothetical protein